MTLAQAVSIFVPTIALFGVLVAWLGNRIARSNAQLSADISRRNAELGASLEANVKLAEFRQNWIDAMRADMAKFQSIATLPQGDPTKEREFYELGTRIELRMNPEDPDYNELQDALYAYYSATDDDEKLIANAPFVEVCQSILKREWDVLKADLRKLDMHDPADTSLERFTKT